MAKNAPSKSTFSQLCDVAVVVRDINKTVKRLEALGLGPFKEVPPPPGAEGMFFRGKLLVANDRALAAYIGNLKLEIIQPGNEPSPWKEFLDKHGEGIHHLGFLVSDVEKEVNQLVNQGAEVILTGNISGKLGAAYVDPKAGNIIIELMSYNPIGLAARSTTAK
jgi:methylmalonyl-CoA/ethylmalonyl-CoA epimerase